MVASVVTTPEGIDALQALTQQAVTPAPGAPAEIQMAVNEIVKSISSGIEGCYPMRRYDMSKVSPQSGITYDFEQYKEFSPLK